MNSSMSAAKFAETQAILAKTAEYGLAKMARTACESPADALGCIAEQISNTILSSRLDISFDGTPVMSLFAANGVLLGLVNVDDASSPNPEKDWDDCRKTDAQVQAIHETVTQILVYPGEIGIQQVRIDDTLDSQSTGLAPEILLQDWKIERSYIPERIASDMFLEEVKDILVAIYFTDGSMEHINKDIEISANLVAWIRERREVLTSSIALTDPSELLMFWPGQFSDLGIGFFLKPGNLAAFVASCEQLTDLGEYWMRLSGGYVEVA